jgi:hypothetical protein
MAEEKTKTTEDRPGPDPGNADPSEWSKPLDEEKQTELRKLLGIEED